MAGEMQKTFGSWVVLEANGATIASLAFSAADDSGFVMATDGSSYPNLEFEVEFTNTVAATGSPFLAFYALDRNLFDGSNNAQAPASSNRRRLVRTEPTALSSTAAQRFSFDVLNAPKDALYYVENGTGQSIASGWKLRARAWTLKPAA
jgi:hypothetical protein